MRRSALLLIIALLAAACSGSGGVSGTMPLVDGGHGGSGGSGGGASTSAPAGTTPATTTPVTTTPVATDPVTTVPVTTSPVTTTPIDLGTRDEPVTAGTPVIVGDWEITVLGANRNATDLVLDENQFNGPPDDGDQFMLVRVATTYLGEGAESPFAGLTFRSVGAGGLTYDVDDGCGVVPDSHPGLKEAFPGGTITGNLCWAVTAADAATLVLIAEPAFTFSGGLAYLEIPEDGVTFEAPAGGGLVPDGGPPGTRGNPIDAGDSSLVGAWEITVAGSIWDATELVLDGNQFNDPPGEGRRFVIVEVQATNRGIESEPAAATLAFAAVGPAAVAYDYLDDCGVVPDPLPTLDEVFAGGTITGNLCWSVRDADLDGLVMYVTETFSPDAQRVFFEVP